MHTRHDPRSSSAGTLFLFILLFVLMAHVSARADTLLVPEDYTLSSALAAATSGDSVSVAAGTLQGATVDLVAGVVLLSREDAANDLATINAVDLAEPADVVGFRVYNPSGAVQVYVKDCQLNLRRCELSYVSGENNWPILYQGQTHLLFEDCHIQHCVGYCPHVECYEQYAIGPSGTFPVQGCTVTLRRCLVEDQDFLLLGGGSVLLEDSTFLRCGSTLAKVYGDLSVTGCVVAHCYPTMYYTGLGPFGPNWVAQPLFDVHSGPLELIGNTFVDNPVQEHYGVYFPAEDPVPLIRTNVELWRFERNVVAGLTYALVEATGSFLVACNDIYPDVDPLWIGGIDDPSGQDGNISDLPLFCDREGGDYQLCDGSAAAVAPCGIMGALGVGCDCASTAPEVPITAQTRFLRAVPNPFNPNTVIHFELATTAAANLAIFDAAGRKVRTWRWSALAAGPHELQWQGRDKAGNPVAAGAYHLRLESGDSTDHLAVVLVK